jgi:hypothetical protein
VGFGDDDHIFRGLTGKMKRRIIHVLVEPPITKGSGNQLNGI